MVVVGNAENTHKRRSFLLDQPPPMMLFFTCATFACLGKRTLFDVCLSCVCLISLALAIVLDPGIVLPNEEKDEMLALENEVEAKT